MPILVVVEAPGKVSKIQSILGNEYHVCASVGHIEDLDEHSLSININNNFEPIYVPKDDKKQVIRDLKRLYKKYNDVIIATDDDREGEMIAWSIMNVLHVKNPKRITFHAITKNEILNAIKKPRMIDEYLVNAQKARRATDRIVGFETTPTLYKHFKMQNLSAGRVQSVVVRRLVDRENEIEKFMKENNTSFFKIKCKFDPNIESILYRLPDDDKVKSQDLAKNLIQKCIESEFIISKVTLSKISRSPLPPYVTSSLQQDAHKRFGYSSKTTMQLAQRLYENGLITYMRTDSVTISFDAMNEIKKYIIDKYGDRYYRYVEFKTKSKNAQEAHECIRPTHIDQLNSGLSNEYDKLYKMIWKRTIACQMSPAQYDATDAKINISKLPEYFCLATMKKIVFRGFLILGSEEDDDLTNDNLIFKEGTKLNLIEILGEEQYNNHPPRFDEGSLIKEMEKLGIGRPSTYASIMNTIQKRGYVNESDNIGIKKICTKLKWTKNDKLINIIIDEKVIWADKKKIIPTHLGKSITTFLLKYFEIIMDYKFTADMEDKFDEIAGNRYSYVQLMKEFYSSFHPLVIKAMNTTSTIDNDKYLGDSDKCKYYASINRYGPVVKKINNNGECSYASIYKPLTQDTINLDGALELFKFPKKLGIVNDTDMLLCNGPYGYYIKYGDRNISIKDQNITYEDAIKIIDEKDNKVKFEDENNTYSINDGRYGKYIVVCNKKTKKNKNIPISGKNKNNTITSIEDISKIISNYKEYKKEHPIQKKLPYQKKK